MSDGAIRPTSGAVMAAAVRQFAIQARRAMVDSASGGDGTENLSGRIAVLQNMMQGQPPSDLTRWLENLRRRVEATPEAVA